jgi:hypothetical protein
MWMASFMCVPRRRSIVPECASIKCYALLIAQFRHRMVIRDEESPAYLRNHHSTVDLSLACGMGAIIAETTRKSAIVD